MAALVSPQTKPQETTLAPITPAVPSERRRGGRRRRSEIEAERVRMAMYFSTDGRLHHSRCKQPLQFRGVRAEVEGDFWCRACHEHVTVPTYAVAGIPVHSHEDEPTTLLRIVR